MLLSIIVDKADAPDIILERNPYEECSGASYIKTYHIFIIRHRKARTATAPTTSGKVARGLYQGHLPPHATPSQYFRQKFLKSVALRSFEDLFGSSLFFDTFFIEEQDSVCNFSCKSHLMSYDNHCHAFICKLLHK